MEVFLSNSLIVYLLYKPGLGFLFEFFRFLMELYPPFNFSKCYIDIASISGRHFDNFANKWVEVLLYLYKLGSGL
jgi:hypothetical protein